MAGFLRYVSVQMVIADDGGGASLPYSPYRFCSSTRFRGGAFSGYRNGYTGVPVIRPQFYTGVCVSLLIHPQFYRNGYSGGNHQEGSGGGNHQEDDSGEETETELGQEILDVKFECRREMKAEISVQGDSALKKFCNFFENITQFLVSLEKFLIIFMTCLNKIFGDGMKASLENNGTQMSTTRDSDHCYHYCYCYDRDYDRDCIPEIPEYCPCIPLRIGASLGHEIIENRSNGKMVEECCKYCKLCNPPRAEANNRTQTAYNRTLAAGNSYHCYHYCYCYDRDDRDGVDIPVSPECCPCIPLRIGAYLGHEIIENGNNGKMVEKCCKYCKLCNPPRAY